MGFYLTTEDAPTVATTTKTPARASFSRRFPNRRQFPKSPFGEVIRATGPMAAANPFRFSTKYYDQETGLYYYVFRFYSPTLGRWLSRDPLGEMGGRNLYGFVGNDAINIVDILGLEWTREGVLKLLCKTDDGRRIVLILNQDNVKVMKSEFVRSYLRRRANANATWGEWEPKEWGAMTSKQTTEGKQQIVIHMPKSYSDELAAFFLIHEGTHAGSGAEEAAYKAETQFGILVPEVHNLIRQGFVKKGGGGKEEVDIEAIKKFIEDKYTGWYQEDPLVQYKTTPNGGKVIDYGKETQEKPWECCDEKKAENRNAPK